MRTRSPGRVIRAIAHDYDRDLSYLAFAYELLAPVNHEATSWDEQVTRYAQFSAMQDACQL